jgi:hypothetical protein
MILGYIEVSYIQKSIFMVYNEVGRRRRRGGDT